jgi:hypothetical protein
MMAKWELDCTNGSAVVVRQGPRPGQIRVVNYVDGETVPVDAFGNKGNPILVHRHRIEQFWDGKWAPIKVYHDPGNGKLERIKQ